MLVLLRIKYTIKKTMTMALIIQHMLFPSCCEAITFSFLMVVAKLVPKSLNELD